MENRGRKGKYCQYIANMAIWYDIEAPYIVRYDTDLAVLQYYYEMSILPIFVLFVLLATLSSNFRDKFSTLSLGSELLRRRFSPMN
jgi:hypothetical protein